MQLSYWIQKPLFNVGWHNWREMGGLEHKAVTIFLLCIGITLYYSGRKSGGREERQ